MTVSTAINKAMAVFNKTMDGDIRSVELMEGTGSGKNWKSIVIHIIYAVNGDYTESDTNPFDVKVYESNGKIIGERVI